MPDRTGRHIVGRHSVQGWHIGSDDPNVGELDVENAAGKLTVEGAIPNSTWTHVATTYDPGGRIALYVKGTLQDSKANASTSIGALPSARLRLGCRAAGVNVFDGLVDDIRLYSRILSEAEIAALAR